MPDLEYAHDLALTWLPILEKWSVPRLLTAGHIQLQIQAHLSSLEFPPLVAAEEIIIAGNVLEVAFDELRAINGGIYIGNVDPLIVDFVGNISAVSLPSLQNITDGFWINSSSPLSLDLPLENVDEVYVNEYSESIDLPNLRN
ncbi:hypothetical protein BJX65DRAFT_311146 [Aspergillus insuetus]